MLDLSFFLYKNMDDLSKFKSTRNNTFQKR